MIIQLYMECTFDAAHFLRDYEGKCKNLHGHTYKLSIWIRGQKSNIQKNDILFDFGKINEIKEYFDHKNLNEIEFFMEQNPTAENICFFIYDELKKDRKELEFKIRLYETKVGKETYCETGDWI